MLSSFRSATIEISNVCNARCRWCTTGVRNRKNIITKPDFMSSSSFEKCIDHMLTNNIINQNTEIELYNWGEPFLNPQLQNILKIIDDRCLKFHISTNGSKIDYFTGEYIEGLTLFMVSISGFSQRTYGKIHGFAFDNILENIERIADILSSKGKLEKMQVNMHVYKFNLHELETAKAHFKSKGIPFVPRLAYFNDFAQFQRYLNHSFSKKDLDCVNRHILTEMLDEMAEKAPETYVCPQMEKIVLNENCDIVPCCRLTTDQKLGNLFDYSSYEEIKALKKSCTLCRECMESKQSYIVHRPMRFRFELS